MDKFDRRLGAELHRELDSQVVHTPPPRRARYARPARPAWQPRTLRTAAVVTAFFAVGVLVGLGYGGRAVSTFAPGGHLRTLPPAPPPASTVATTAPAPTSHPTARASGRPSGRPRPSASASPSPGPPALADDFSADPVGANPPAGWHVDDGDWTGVVDDGGHVVRHGAGQAGGHLVAGSPQWTDYSVSADVSTALLDLGSAGVAGRYQGPGADYECVVNVGGQLELWVAQGGQRRLLGASAISLDLTGRHAIGLDMRGSHLVCSLDGAPLLRVTDATYAAGRVALVASTDEAAEFGDVRVSG